MRWQLDAGFTTIDFRLRQLRPQAVVICEPCLEAIRAVEVFSASSTGATEVLQVDVLDDTTVKREPGTGLVFAETSYQTLYC